jgi:hypothetical protein
VEVLNATYSTVHSAVIEATLFDREMKVQWHIDLINDLEGNSRVKLKESVPVGKAPSFLKLKITDQHGNCLADNFYWLHGSNNFRSLHSLEPPDLTISSLEKLDGETSGYRFTITNQGDGLALMTRMKVIDPLSGQELLPAFWSDNFISLLPDEGKEIFLTIGDQNLPEHITITYQSYNMDAPGNLSMEGR